LGGRKGIQSVKNEWWGAGVVICLEQGAELHMAQLMPLHCHSLSLASVKCRFVLPFCYWLSFSALTLLVGWQEGHPAYKN